MSREKNKTGRFTLTWKIENIGCYLSTGRERWLDSPYFKKKTTKENGFWQLKMSNFQDPNIQILFVPYEKWHIPEKCEISLMTNSGDIPLDCRRLEELFYAVTDKKSLNKVISEESLTISIKLWLPSQESEDHVIRTVLHTGSLLWNMKKGHCDQKTFLGTDSSLLGIILKKGNIQSENKTLVISFIPSIDGCPSLVDCKLLIRDIQVRFEQLQPVWPDLSWETNLNFKGNSSSNIEFQLDYIEAVHLSSPDHLPQASLPASAAAPWPPGTLNNDLLLLYREKSFSDATLNTEGKSFSAHKSILSARSSVFRAMFEKDEMSEGRTGVVDIDDVDSETVDRMLVFLYGDSLEDVQWEEALTLYYAADKYDVQPLKQKCADILKDSLSADNACDALVLADKHADGKLMKCVVDFLCEHQEVISSARWEELEDRNSKLTSKITREILLNKCKEERVRGKEKLKETK